MKRYTLMFLMLYCAAFTWLATSFVMGENAMGASPTIVALHAIPAQTIILADRDDGHFKNFK